MKHLLAIVLLIFSSNSFGQDKNNYVHFNQLTEVKGTAYVMASIEDKGKAFETTNAYLLFINTITFEKHKVDFPQGARIAKVEQIKIDSLSVNLIILEASTVDLDSKNGIDWNDPTQIIALSTNGQEMHQLTESEFFVRTWAVNRLT